MPFNTLLQKTGLVAILRGVKPDEIVAIGEKLYAAGFRLIEIPMNFAGGVAKYQFTARRPA